MSASLHKGLQSLQHYLINNNPYIELSKEPMTEKPSATLPGTVEKIIKSPLPANLKKHRSPSKARITYIRRSALRTP